MPLDVDPEILASWQKALDTLAELLEVPSALIMRVVEKDIEVFAASTGQANPYNPGDREELEFSGLYCEWVIRNRDKLHVPDALADAAWMNNPDIKLDMIAYLGLPVRLPDGSPFGTICVLDRVRRKHTPLAQRVLTHFRDMVEDHLLLLDQRLRLMRTLRGIVPICASCHKIRDSRGAWQSLEAYITDRTEAEFSHGVCPDCMQHYI